MTQPQRPLPQPTKITQPYWDAAKEKRLIVQECGCCKIRQFYTREFCTSCLSEDMRWIDSSGHGTVYTYTINRRAATPGMSDSVPYIVAAVDLDEGVRMFANVVDCPIEAVKIGSRVHVCFEKVSDEITLPQFRLEV